jgi:hypothetical protein
MEEEMEELYIEGLANHDDREPYVGAREGAGEASVAARARRPAKRWETTSRLRRKGAKAT